MLRNSESEILNTKFPLNSESEILNTKFPLNSESEILNEKLLLNELLKKGDVIAIIGSGGKTTLAYELAKNVSYKFLLTTTTKMKKSNYEYINYHYSLPNELKNGVNFVAKSISDEKVGAFSDDELEELIKKCDICVYEADGAKEKPLKAWLDSEPVILKSTTKCIGVMPLHLLNKELDEDLVHRFSLFKQSFKSTYFNEDLVIKLCFEMFKKVDENIEKYIYFNRVSTDLENIIKRLNGFKIFASFNTGELKRMNF